MKSVLICRLRSLGDIIRTFPAIEGLKGAYKNLEIGFLCSDKYRECVSLLRCVSNIHSICDKEIDFCSDLTPLKSCVEEIRGMRYDVYIDLHGIYSSALLGVLCNIPIRIGYASDFVKHGSDLCYTSKFILPKSKINRFDRHSHLISRLFDKTDPQVVDLHFQNKPQKSNGVEVLICPGSSLVGRLKRWPAINYARLIKIIKSISGVSCLIASGPEDYDISDEIVNLYQGDLQHCKPIGMESIFYLTQKASVVVGSDGAWIHAASVQGTPSLMLMGPTSFEVNRPWSKTLYRCIHLKKECSPCYCWDYECHNNKKCMVDITVDAVAEALLDLLGAIKQ